MFDRLLHEKAIESGCVPLIQTIRENNGQLQHLSKTFDYLIDARGVSVGGVTAIAIRAYWMLNRQNLSDVDLIEAQIHFIWV